MPLPLSLGKAVRCVKPWGSGRPGPRGGSPSDPPCLRGLRDTECPEGLLSGVQGHMGIWRTWEGLGCEAL